MAETRKQIRDLARNLSNQNSTDIINDSDFDIKINNWYQNKLSVEIGHGLERTWRLTTLPNVDKYFVGTEYIQLKGTNRIDGDPLNWYLEPDRFYDDYQDAYAHVPNLEVGDGITTSFSGTLSINNRIIPETVSFGDDTETFEDDGDGILTGSLTGSGTINYLTGAWALIFNTIPADGTTITCSYGVYISSIPDAILYSNANTADGGSQEIVFRPIPDGNYSIELDYEARPTALSSDSATPTYLVWGDLIAYGVAIDILESFGQLSEAQALSGAYRRILDTVHGVMSKIESKRIKVPRW